MRLRIGIVSYLNTAPLLFSLREISRTKSWSLIEDHPTALNQALHQNNLDLALISSFEYALNAEEYLLIPDISISATGRVGSVLLFSSKPIETLQGELVVLTKTSATSVALLKLLLEDFYDQSPLYQVGTLQEGQKATAYLAIGDEALRLRQTPPFPRSYDLAALWMERTRLPFVFALFAVRKDSWRKKASQIKEFVQELYLSRARGLARLPVLANQCRILSGLSLGECLLYLKGIEYDLSGLKQEALAVFFQHLLRRKEIPLYPRLDFIDL